MCTIPPLPPRKQGGIRGHRFDRMCFNNYWFYYNDTISFAVIKEEDYCPIGLRKNDGIDIEIGEARFVTAPSHIPFTEIFARKALIHGSSLAQCPVTPNLKN